MKKYRTVYGAILLSALVALLLGGAASPAFAATQPNIVFIMSDDQDIATMQYMPRVQELLAAQGATFANSFVSEPQCCPSNVTALTGQYAHNHGVLNNLYPTGGFQTFVENGGDQRTIATWLQDAGYNTARVGKYLVQYPEGTTYIPPGWNEWYSSYDGFTSYFNYRMNENGTVVQYGAEEEDYITDVFTAKAVDFIDRAEANDDQPFFLTFTPTAPHADSLQNGPATPAPRHAGMFAGAMAPRTPSFNEADVSDKPAPIRNFPLLTSTQIAAIDHEYQHGWSRCRPWTRGSGGSSRPWPSGANWRTPTSCSPPTTATTSASTDS